MKQQDIAVLIIIIFISGVGSFFLSSKLVSPSEKKETVEIVSPIKSEFNIGNASNINPDAINPTVLIEIAPVENTQPFKNTVGN